MGDAYLQLIEVTKRFDGRAVLDCVSLDVAEGEIVALLGASGCGKTTLLRLVAGLERPDAGEVGIGGVRVASAGRNVVPPYARSLGFVFQDLALWPHLTVAGNLEFVLRAAGIGERERRARIDEVLRLVHIEAFARKYPNQLSGGEQQRAAIARALVARPKLLLLDEPMSSLDTELKEELLTELVGLQRALHVTTLYVTHDREEAVGIAQRVALMREGRVESAGTTEMLRTRLRGNYG